MLPMPIPSKTISVILGHDKEAPAEDGGDDQGLHAAAEDLISAVHSKDAAAVAEALKNAFAICDQPEAEPEGE